LVFVAARRPELFIDLYPGKYDVFEPMSFALAAAGQTGPGFVRKKKQA
jgi:hypothetical protein